MNKFAQYLIFFWIFLIPNYSIAESYLHEVDSCARKNKKMGDLAWKQCANKLQFSDYFRSDVSGSASFNYSNILLNSLTSNNVEKKPTDKVKNFNFTLYNNVNNFIVTQIDNLVIKIDGKDDIVIDNVNVNTWPNTTFSPNYNIDVSPYNLKRADVKKNNWSWSFGTVHGVRIAKKEEKLFKTKTTNKDIDRCVKKLSVNRSGKKDSIELACIYALSEELKINKIKVKSDLYYKFNDNNDLINYIKTNIVNDISNDFKITRILMKVSYKGDNCSGTYLLSKTFGLGVEPGKNYNLEENFEKKGLSYNSTPCTKTSQVLIDYNAWGIFY